MEPGFSNYDMFDKLIANNKKAQSWTVFWIAALCILAGTIIWMAYDISQKKRTIAQQKIALQTQEEFLEAKNHLIDSLVANCNVAKTEIVDKCDSVISETQAAIKAVLNVQTIAGGNDNLSLQQETKLKEANESIRYIKNNLYTIKRDLNHENVRVFIQYNNKEDRPQINKLLAQLKTNTAFFVAPADFIENIFPTIIKFYNFKNDEEEKNLKTLLSKLFRLEDNAIKVSYETNEKIKPTIEIWIATNVAGR